MYMHTSACKIDGAEALEQGIRVCTGHLHDNLHKHACMSVMYMPNLVCMHVDVNTNCKPRIMI